MDSAPPIQSYDNRGARRLDTENPGIVFTSYPVGWQLIILATLTNTNRDCIVLLCSTIIQPLLSASEPIDFDYAISFKQCVVESLLKYWLSIFSTFHLNSFADIWIEPLIYYLGHGGYSWLLKLSICMHWLQLPILDQISRLDDA